MKHENVNRKQFGKGRDIHVDVHVSRDAQNLCAITIEGTVLKDVFNNNGSLWLTKADDAQMMLATFVAQQMLNKVAQTC